MGKSNNKTAPIKKDLFRVIGEDGSAYLLRERRYLKKNEELVLEPHEAEVLLAAGLVAKVEAPAPQDNDEIQEN